tara:strand:- start:691 stop:897 length:207 start_codon:yes stop_codon:yes gene_type:complete
MCQKTAVEEKEQGMSASTFKIYELAEQWAAAEFERGRTIGRDDQEEFAEVSNNAINARLAFESLMRNS